MLRYPVLRARILRPLAIALLAALARPAEGQVQARPPAAALTAARDSDDALIPATALREDVRVLRTALQALHPGLYRYVTPAELDRRFARLATRLGGDRTPSEAFLAIAELTAALRCGHTYPNPNNQPRAVAAAVFGRTPRVPFYFRWLGSRMIVTRDLTSEGHLPAGTEVLAINGVAAATVLARLLPYARADGGNDAKRVANLEVQPGERWPAFDVYFPLVFAPPAGPWTFRVRLPEALPEGTGGVAHRAPRTVAAPPVDAARRLADFDSRRDSLRRGSADTTAPPWTLRVDADGLATLTMPTWVTFNDRWDWPGFVHRAFVDLAARGATALVIDLRGNEGGTGVGDVLLAHLVGRDAVPGELRRYTRYRQAPEALRPYLDTWDRSFDDWGPAAVPSAAPPGAGVATGFYQLTRADDSVGAVVHPAAPRFGGRVFVLVGADNSSATFGFALAARALGIATLVGAPTGGNRRGINGGAFYFLRLPHSRIEVDLPLIGFYAPGPRPDAGLVPDVRVRTTPADVAAGRDPELTAVRRLLPGAGREEWRRRESLRSALR